MQNEFPAHTPELARLLAEMNSTAAALKKIVKKVRQPFASPEYAASRKAWRAYWHEVDADKAAKV